MPHVSHRTDAELEQRRVGTVRKLTEATLVLANTCPTTRGGVVIVRAANGNHTKAYLFRRHVVHKPYAVVHPTTAHEMLDLIPRVARDAQAQQDRRTMWRNAPHNLAVGSILHGAGDAEDRFFQVVAIPTPKSVSIAAIPAIKARGPWNGPPKLPQAQAPARLGDDPRHTVRISMSELGPKGRLGDLRLTLWRGEIVRPRAQTPT